ncbi:hypothetical protein DENSPDRAFT_886615 [Dentipellis sp. KUC8613]|nr:hypothetical protein DENSPDRAFT_886615 [Dentipellis sp. KUC8613]
MDSDLTFSGPLSPVPTNPSSDSDGEIQGNEQGSGHAIVADRLTGTPAPNGEPGDRGTVNAPSSGSVIDLTSDADSVIDLDSDGDNAMVVDRSETHTMASASRRSTISLTDDEAPAPAVGQGSNSRDKAPAQSGLPTKGKEAVLPGGQSYTTHVVVSTDRSAMSVIIPAGSLPPGDLALNLSLKALTPEQSIARVSSAASSAIVAQALGRHVAIRPGHSADYPVIYEVAKWHRSRGTGASQGRPI